MKRSRHGGRKIWEVGRKVIEESAEIIGEVVVEEYLKFRLRYIFGLGFGTCV